MIRPCSLFALFVVPSLVAAAEPEPKSPAELLPSSTVFYAEMSDPHAAVESLLEHPLRERLLAVDGIREALETDDGLRKLNLFMGGMKERVGFSYDTIVEKIAGRGLAFGFDGKTRSGVILARGPDADTLKATWDAVVFLASMQAGKQGRGNKITTIEYRGQVVHRLGKLKVAVVRDWIVATDNDEHGKAVVDRLLDGATGSLSERESFRAANEAREKDVAWAFIDIERLRVAGLLENLRKQRGRNPAFELFAGGVVEGLNTAPYATLTLVELSDATGLRLEFASPFDVSAFPEERQYDRGSAPQPLPMRNGLMTIAGFRDLSAFWADSGTLFDDETAGRFEQANGTLSTLFSGLDFGDEVLGELRPEMQIVVRRRTFAAGKTPIPAMKLPAFAAVFRTRTTDADELADLRRRFRVTFQSLTGFANVAGAQNGLTQLDVQQEKLADGTLVWGEYLYHADDAGTTTAPVQYNFTPALAISGDRVILASTRDLAVELARAKPRPQPGGEAVVNGAITLDVGMLRDVLADNRGQLIAQNMLEKGHDRAAAEREIGTFLQLLGLVRDTSLEMLTEADTLRVRFDVRLVNGHDSGEEAR